MAEPIRSESPAPKGALRDSQIEALLVEGLDRYFAARYDEAIHIWTRVLFLDRSHARARAYIDRARTALAERQREAEALLEASHDLIEQGKTGPARDLLSEAVAATGDDERASAVRARLERLERVERLYRQGSADAAVPVTPGLSAPVAGWSWPRHSSSRWAILGVLAVVFVVVSGVATPSIREWVQLGVSHDPVAVPAQPDRFALLSSSDVAFVRARQLYTRGRLAEALQSLDRVSPDSPVRRQADELRVQIQQLLLASGREPGSTARGTARR